MVTNADIKILNEFLENRDVKYVLTGSAALFYHGMLMKGNLSVNDIDIIVLTTRDTRKPLQTMFKELERFTGCEKINNYPTQNCYTFKVGPNNVLVNVFEGPLGDVPYCQMNIDNDTEICVHPVMNILERKFGLRRQKDYDYYLALIQHMSSLFFPKFEV